jgi:hypothetical protein
MTGSRVGALLVAASALLASGARAAEEVTVVAGVRVAPPACPMAPLSIPAFVDSLRVELASGVRAAGSTLVTLAIEPCDTSTARVHVAVISEPAGPSAGRDVGLEDIAWDARPRALALAVAELVRSAQASAVAPPPEPAVLAPPAPPSGPPPAEERRPGLGGAADGILQLYPARDAVMWGGRLSVTLARGPWGAALYGEAAAGQHGYDVGDVSLQSFGGGVVLGRGFAARRLVLTPALVGALGWTRIQGHADAPDVSARSGSGPTAAVRARVAAQTALGSASSLRAFVEAGWMVRAVAATVDGARAAGASGTTIVVGLGVAL